MAAGLGLSMLARRWLINLALLAVLGVLALIVRLDLREDARASRLTDLAPDEVERIVLKRAGEPMIRLERSGPGWRMLEPHAVPADAEAVSRLLPVAQAAVARTLPAAGLDPGALGLAPAGVDMSLDGLTLRFGGNEPVAALRYVQVGDMVHLIEDRYLPRLMTPITALVSRRLLPPDFSPGLGDLDGEPLAAGQLAPLADATAVRVETPGAALHADAPGARELHISSADGGDGLHFRISDGGRHWTRLDTQLSWRFATPPLPAAADALAAAPDRRMPPADPPPAPAAPPRQREPAPAQRQGPAAAAAAQSDPAAPLPVQRLAPPAPGSEPRDRRPTAAIPQLREMAPQRRRDPSALPQTGADPFAPSTDAARAPAPAPVPDPAPDPAPAAAPQRPAETPLRVEKRSP
ncbi:hypothetical protein [Thiohalocapsa halophila]